MMIAILRSPHKKILVLFGLLILCISCDTANNIESPDKSYFLKYYGGDGDQSAVDLLLTDDNSIYLLGNWASSVSGINKIYLVKVDQFGRTVHEWKLGTGQDFAKDLELTADGNLVILADHVISEANTDVKIIRLSIDGEKIDSVVYGSIGIEIASSITPLQDGGAANGFIVTGTTTYDTSTVVDPTRPDDQADIFHFRCDAAFNFLSNTEWRGQYGPGTFDGGTKAFQVSPDLFYIFGSSNQSHAGNSNNVINLTYYSIDDVGANGTPNYLESFLNKTETSFVMETTGSPGKGYLILGTEYRSNSQAMIRAVKLRSPLVFNTINDQQFNERVTPENKRIEAVSATSSVSGTPGYIVVGNEFRETGRNIWISKINQNGRVLWSASYGSESDDDRAAAIAETKDGRVLVAGTIKLVNNQSKMVLMKLNSNGLLND